MIDEVKDINNFVKYVSYLDKRNRSIERMHKINRIFKKCLIYLKRKNE